MCKGNKPKSFSKQCYQSVIFYIPTAHIRTTTERWRPLPSNLHNNMLLQWCKTSVILLFITNTNDDGRSISGEINFAPLHRTMNCNNRHVSGINSCTWLPARLLDLVTFVRSFVRSFDRLEWRVTFFVGFAFFAFCSARLLFHWFFSLLFSFRFFPSFTNGNRVRASRVVHTFVKFSIVLLLDFRVWFNRRQSSQ